MSNIKSLIYYKENIFSQFLNKILKEIKWVNIKPKNISKKILDRKISNKFLRKVDRYGECIILTFSKKHILVLEISNNINVELGEDTMNADTSLSFLFNDKRINIIDPDSEINVEYCFHDTSKSKLINKIQYDISELDLDLFLQIMDDQDQNLKIINVLEDRTLFPGLDKNLIEKILKNAGFKDYKFLYSFDDEEKVQVYRSILNVLSEQYNS